MCPFNVVNVNVGRVITRAMEIRSIFMVICKKGLSVRNLNDMRLKRGWGRGACSMRANVKWSC